MCAARLLFRNAFSWLSSRRIEAGSSSSRQLQGQLSWPRTGVRRVGIGADHVPLQQQSATWATLTAAGRTDEAPSCCSIVTRRQKCKVPRASANYITIRAPPRCQSSSLRSDRRLQQDAHRHGQGGELEPGGCCRRPASNRQPLGRVLEGQGGAMGCAWSWARLLAPPLELVLALVLVLAWCRRISACLRAFARRCSSQMASMANAGARASRMVVVGRYNNALSSCSARPAICTSSLSPTRTSFSTSLVELLAYHEPTALTSRNQPNASAAREYHLPPHGQEAVCCWQDGGNSRQARVLLLVHVHRNRASMSTRLL